MIARILFGVLAALPVPALAITGGVSVEDVLRGTGGQQAGPELVATAQALAAVTVALVKVDAQDRVRSLCSGTLIHPRVVLTAAHCVFDQGRILSRMTVLFPDGMRAPARRQALDVVVHPFILELMQQSNSALDREQVRTFIRTRGPQFLMSDVALVLLHRPAPETSVSVAMVPPGFRDDRGFRKLIAGFGVVDKATPLSRLELRFADLRGNTRDYQGAISGGAEIIMESHYRDGTKVNVCHGDSGGPVLVVERGGSGLRQIGVTSAGDCREYALFAPIDAQRGTLRRMFDTLIQGEPGAQANPF